MSDAPKLSPAVIEDLKGKGFTQSEIARMFGVTRQAVSDMKIKYGGRRTPREIVLDNFPWEVSAEQSQCSAFRRLRDHGEYFATKGEGMSYEKLSRLRGFYARLREENVVLEYDPTLPPVPGFCLKGGFAFRERKPEDGDLLIRVNEHTNLTPEGQIIWRFQEVEP